MLKPPVRINCQWEEASGPRSPRGNKIACTLTQGVSGGYEIDRTCDIEGGTPYDVGIERASLPTLVRLIAPAYRASEASPAPEIETASPC